MSFNNTSHIYKKNLKVLFQKNSKLKNCKVYKCNKNKPWCEKKPDMRNRLALEISQIVILKQDLASIILCINTRNTTVPNRTVTITGSFHISLFTILK